MWPDASRMRTPATGTPLGRLADQAAERVGHDSTLVFEGSRTSLAELHDRSCRVAGGLAELAVGPGDRVALCMANCPEVLEVYRAVWRLGAAVTPLLFLLSADELRHALADSGASVVVTTPEFALKVMAAAAGSSARIVVVGAPPEDTVPFAELVAAAPAPLADVDPTSLAALLYTGGTTGRAKGVMLSHDALSAAAWSATLSDSEDELRASLLSLPVAHVFGLLVSCMSLHSLSPKDVVLMRWFEATAWLRLVQDERVEQASVVPAMLRALAAAPLEQFDLTSLRRLTSGSAPLPGDVVDALADRLPGVEIVEGYGCSETAALATKTPAGQVRRDSVGIAQPGVDLRIDGGSVDVDGEILVRTPSLMTGYWHDADATAAVIDGGWFRTGDIGHLDADGYLYLVDRVKDVIIRNGFNVYPRDVEDTLTSHPDVTVCAVVGRPDERTGEEVLAYVQLRAGATTTPEELVTFAREHLSAAKYPREIRVIDSVPLTSIGKLDRKALRGLGQPPVEL